MSKVIQFPKKPASPAPESDHLEESIQRIQKARVLLRAGVPLLEVLHYITLEAKANKELQS